MVHVGTSGWQYAHWKRVFYPDKLPQREWLPYFADHFQTVEVNNTFYNLPDQSVFAAWAARTPADFCFSLKMSRFLTHLKRLVEPKEPVQRFFDRAAVLGHKLGPVLIQLPPGFKSDVARLDHALESFPTGVRIAVEFRDPSWFTDDLRALLERRGVALCLADSPRRKQPTWRTADWGFVRFHEGRGSHPPGYERDVLARWVESLASLWTAGEDVYVYFNNDRFGYAIEDAVTFAGLTRAAGLSTTRVPSPGVA